MISCITYFVSSLWSHLLMYGVSTECNKNGVPSFMPTAVLHVNVHVVLLRYARESAVLCKSYHNRL